MKYLLAIAAVAVVLLLCAGIYLLVVPKPDDEDPALRIRRALLGADGLRSVDQLAAAARTGADSVRRVLSLLPTDHLRADDLPGGAVGYGLTPVGHHALAAAGTERAVVVVTPWQVVADATTALQWSTPFSLVVDPAEVTPQDVEDAIVLATDLDPRLAALAAELWILKGAFRVTGAPPPLFEALLEGEESFDAWVVTELDGDHAPDGDLVLHGPVAYDVAAKADHVVLADGFRYRVTSAFDAA
jgi:hypothetical protein